MRRPGGAAAGNKYAWLVGIVLFMGLGVLLFVQTIPNQRRGPQRAAGRASGCRRSRRRRPRATLEGDANVCQREPLHRRAPGRCPPARCVARDVVNVCELRRRPLVLTFMFDRGADCDPQVDRTERVRGESARACSSRPCSSATRSATRSGGSCEARALDAAGGGRQDGAVANLYGVGGCPTTVFAHAGGQGARARSSATSPRSELRRGRSGCADDRARARRERLGRARAGRGVPGAQPRARARGGAARALAARA